MYNNKVVLVSIMLDNYPRLRPPLRLCRKLSILFLEFLLWHPYTSFFLCVTFHVGVTKYLTGATYRKYLF